MGSEENKRITERLGEIAKQIAQELGPRMFADQPGASGIELNINLKMRRSGECIIDIGAIGQGVRRPDCDDLKKEDKPCAEHECDDAKAKKAEKAKPEDKPCSKHEAPKASTPLNDALNKLFDDVQARNKKPE